VAASTTGRHAAQREARPGPDVGSWAPRTALALAVAVGLGLVATASSASTSGSRHPGPGVPGGAIESGVSDLSRGAPKGAKVLGATPVHAAKPAAATPAVVSGLAANGIPTVALNAYRAAAARMASAEPGCGISWPLLAGIGRVESNHGQYGGAVLLANGTSSIPIIGQALDGVSWDYIADTDGGRFDGDPRLDHAVGPMQFIPSTWAIYGADADGDGIANPFDINDAALGAARYLCAAGGNLRTTSGQQRAVLAYNHSDEYLALVLATAAAYANGISAGGPITGVTTGQLPPLNTSFIPPVNPGPPAAVGSANGAAAPPTRTGARSPQPTGGRSAAPTSSASPTTGPGSGSGASSGAGGGGGSTPSPNPTPTGPTAPTLPIPLPSVPGLTVPTVSSIPKPVASVVCTITGLLGTIIPIPCPSTTR
jgi:hypothetical protein